MTTAEAIKAMSEKPGTVYTCRNGKDLYVLTTVGLLWLNSPRGEWCPIQPAYLIGSRLANDWRPAA
ncbi:MAG: hypothetical protein JST51_01655 [Armatimonadetes bacterium]|nr:hypothetical protein [Armatimonadota bacterium]